MSSKLLPLVTLACLAAITAGCGDLVRQGRGPVMVVVDNIEAAAGGEGTGGAFLLSDVLAADGITVINDNGVATLRSIAKNPISVGSLSPINDITITRYRVTYRRSDGLSTPGRDVPYPIESAAAARIPTAGSAEVAFELVRHNQKREAPLAGLGSGLVKLSMLADVTFYGHDQAGNDVSAAGSIGVTFGNFFGT
jgi:hypothetical protein